MRSAVSLARRVFEEEESGERRGNGKEGLVALSLGVYGATLSPLQEYSSVYPPDI